MGVACKRETEAGEAGIVFTSQRHLGEATLHIPTYSIVILGLLIYLGIKRCYARTIQPTRLFVLPAVMVVFGVLNLPRLFPAAGLPQGLALMMVLAIGGWIGWLHAARWQLQLDTLNKVVRVPGDPVLLLIILLTFAAEFFIHYEIESQGAWAKNEYFSLCSFAIWGGLCGLSFGRASNVFMRYQAARGRF